MSKERDRLTEDIRRVLHEQNGHLDRATLKQLRLARQSALSGTQRGNKKVWAWAAVPVTCALALFFVFHQPDTIDLPSEEQLMDLQILTMDENIDFFLEDMDFYEWFGEIIQEPSSRGSTRS